MNTRLCLSFVLITCALVGCSSSGGMAPNDSPWSGVADAEDWRSVAAKEIMAAYVANDAATIGKWFADDAEIVFNKQVMDKKTFLARIPLDHVHFKDIKLNEIVTTLRYNKTWPNQQRAVFTNIWARWTAEVRKTGAKIEVPVYMFMTWEGKKAKSLNHLFDPRPHEDALESIGVTPY